MENKKTDNIMDIESAMKRLDQVIDKLSAEGVELDAALALYEEGVKLVRECNIRLEDARRRISLLRADADGAVVEEPFDASAID